MGLDQGLDPANEADACLDTVPQGWELPWLHRVLILWECWGAQCTIELLQVLDSVPHPQPQAWEAAGLPGLGPQGWDPTGDRAIAHSSPALCSASPQAQPRAKSCHPGAAGPPDW